MNMRRRENVFLKVMTGCAQTSDEEEEEEEEEDDETWYKNAAQLMQVNVTRGHQDDRERTNT